MAERRLGRASAFEDKLARIEASLRSPLLLVLRLHKGVRARDGAAASRTPSRGRRRLMKGRTRSRAALVAAAVAGLVAGGSLAGCGSTKSDGSSTSDGVGADRHACKGMNACKGMGGCKSGDNGCAGRNSCKGKGGCAVPLKHM
jgi:hypothetical protein